VQRRRDYEKESEGGGKTDLENGEGGENFGKCVVVKDCGSESADDDTNFELRECKQCAKQKD